MAASVEPGTVEERVRQAMYEMHRKRVLADASAGDNRWIAFACIVEIFRNVLVSVDAKKKAAEDAGTEFTLNPLDAETVADCPALAEWATAVGDKWLTEIARHCRENLDHIPYVARWFKRHDHQGMYERCIVDYGGIIDIIRSHELEKDAAVAFLIYICTPGEKRSILGSFTSSELLTPHANFLSLLIPLTSHLSLNAFASYGGPDVATRSAFYVYGFDPTHKAAATFTVGVNTLIGNAGEMFSKWGGAITTLSSNLGIFASTAPRR